MAAQPVTLGAIVKEARVIAVDHKALLLGAFIAIAVFYSTFDLLTLRMRDQGGLGLLTSLSGLVVSIYGQYAVTERLLADRRRPGSKAPMRLYGSLFGVLLLSGIAIGAGLIVLILPGIYLGARWLTVGARVVESNLKGKAALRASWQDSEHSQLAFALALIIGFFPALCMVGLAFADWQDLLTGASASSLVFFDTVLALNSVLGWTVATAAFRKAVPADEDGLNAVFA